MQKWENPDGTVLILNMSENPTLWHAGRLKSSRTTKQFSFYFIIKIAQSFFESLEILFLY